MLFKLSQILRFTVKKGTFADPASATPGSGPSWISTVALRVLLIATITTGLGLFAIVPTLAQEELPAPDPGAAPQQQAPITPANNLPMSNTPPELLFPQSSTSSVPSSRASTNDLISSGLSSGTGLGYRPLASGDLVDIAIFGAPEFSVHMPVSAFGDIAIPYVGVFHIGGMTTENAADAIARLFDERQILHNAHVIVTAQQSGYSVTVLGEVRAPGIISLRGRQRLIDVLTQAGGITNSAGHVIEVFGAESMKNPTTLLWDPTLRENDNADVRLKPGETVLVSRCGVVYVGGNVQRAGAFPLCESNHMTMSEILAQAGGIKPSSWGQRTLLLRTTGTGTRLVQKVKLEDILRGKRADIVLQPDDIIYIPASILKAAGKTILQSAVGFATEAYFYYAVQ